NAGDFDQARRNRFLDDSADQRGAGVATSSAGRCAGGRRPGQQEGWREACGLTCAFTRGCAAISLHVHQWADIARRLPGADAAATSDRRAVPQATPASLPFPARPASWIGAMREFGSVVMMQ